MRKLISILFITLISTLAYSQQFPLQSQYQYNYSVINPAFVVENDFTSVRASFRQQWVGFSDNPIATQLFSVSRGYGKNGLGFNVFNDETGGAFSKSGISLSYAHKVRFPKSQFFPESELNLGVSAGAAKVNIDNLGDPAILNNEDYIPEVTFGLYYKVKDFRLGFSVPGLLNENMELTNSNDNTIYNHFYTVLSYDYSANENLSLHPSILVKSTERNSQVDVNLNLKIRNKIWFGASYRQDFGPSLYVGIDFGRLFSVYSHDISTNEVSSYANGSHEFTIGYDFDRSVDSIVEQPKIEIDTFLFDKDNDGVKDSVDLCPNKFGSKNANGCPDNDNDGIPNEYDLCPNLFGEIDLQGCPEITQFEKNIIYKALRDLKFDMNESAINYSSYPTLTDITLLLLKNPKMFLHITGHSSSEGSSEYNMGLSARRAKSVQNFFKERGIKKSRLILDYLGEGSPLNSNSSEYEKSLNRRVEFKLEYHIHAIDESEKLKFDYKSLLQQHNLDHSFIKEDVVIDPLENNVNFEKVDTDYSNKEDISEENIEDILDILNNMDFPEEDNIDALSNTDSNSEDVEEIIEEKKSSNESQKYILVIAVLSSKENAMSYVAKNSSAKYEFIEGRYYIYEHSNGSKEDLLSFKSTYSKDSWIKEIK
jgi:type IX secretion system PorP/SprF family membrane protein